MPTKYHRHNTAKGNKFNRQQDNNAVFNSAVDEILLQENQKLSSEKGSNENIYSGFYDI